MIYVLSRAAGPTVRPFVALEIRRAVRNRRFIVFTIGFPLVLYLLYTTAGVATSGSADHDPIVGGMHFSAYFMVSMASFAAMSAAFTVGGIRLSMERASGWVRQLRVTPLPAATYVVGKVLVALAIMLPALVLVALAAVLANGVSLSLDIWVRLVLSIWLGSLPLVALAILLGYLFDVEAAQAAQMVLLFGLSIFGGLFIPVQSLPDALATIARMTPTYQLADLGWRAIVGRAPELGGVALLIGYTAVFGALVAWRYRADERSR